MMRGEHACGVGDGRCEEGGRMGGLWRVEEGAHYQEAGDLREQDVLVYRVRDFFGEDA